MVVEADQTARTMAVRVLRSHDLRLGAGAGEGARRGARAHRPRGRPRRLAHTRPGRSPPGSARVPRRDRLSLVAPGRHARRGSPRPHDRDHGHGQRQVAGLQPPGARHARPRSQRARSLPVSDQGARPGPGTRPGAPRPEVPAPGDLRRRHPEGGARRDPPPLEPDPHEPGHAPHGGAAQPSDVGRRARQPRVGGGGRGARVPRRVRLPRGQRAAPAAQARARLRHRAALRAHERHDRQPGGAGRAPDRARLHARGPRRRTAGGAADRDVEPAARERGARAARVRALRGGQPARRPGAARRAHHLLPEVAPRRGADPALRPPAPGGRRPRRPGRADRPLPRRLHARAAARARAPAGRGRAAGGRGHQRARAGHRHRRAGRGDLRDLPGHGREPAPDVGARRAARARAGDVRGGRGRARPVLLPPPRRVPRPAGGAGDPRPRVRGDLPRAPRRRRVRAAADR